MADVTDPYQPYDPGYPALTCGSSVSALLLPEPRSRGFKKKLKSFFRWFTYKENVAVCLFAVVFLAIQLFFIANPGSYDRSKDPPERNMIGDEKYYVGEAYRYLNTGGLQNAEHAPLGKWFIAAGMFLFGDNAFGWRIFSILFGVAAILLFYSICVRLARQEQNSSGTGETGPPPARWERWFQFGTFVPVLATFLFTFENMSFVQAHVAMLDVFSVTFMLLGFLLYLRGNYLSTGMVMGLAMLSKAMALLAILAIVLHWTVTRRSEIAAEVKYTWNALRGKKGVPSARSEILSMIKLLVAAMAVWFALLPLLEYPAIHAFQNPLTRTLSMIETGRTLSGSYWSPTGIATKPWVWLVWPGGMWYSFTPRFISSISWTVWALIIPSTAFLAYQVIKRRVRGLPLATFALLWFLGTYGLLVVMEFAADRLMYHFYFYPSVAAICLAIAWGAWKLWTVARRGRKTRHAFLGGFAFYILATIATFLVMGPFGTDWIKL